MAEFVAMRHPDHGPGGAIAETTREAFDEVWELKGWQLVDAATARASAVLGENVTDISSLSLTKLKAVARGAGVTVDDKAKKDDVIAALNAKLATESEAVNG